MLRVVGNADNLELPALYLYRDWLPASGEEVRDFPISETFPAAEKSPRLMPVLPVARSGQAADRQCLPLGGPDG